MLDIKDFTFFENQNSFDFKGFIIKTLSYWKWFLLGLVICLTIAHQVNIRKQKIYSLETTITIKEEDNPLFTSNTSLTFNWGGSSDEVQTIASTLKSRSHNEAVVDKLQFYIDYLKEEKYFTVDAYGSAPFIVKIDKEKNQLAQIPIKIKFLSFNEFEISAKFNSKVIPVYNYFDGTNTTVNYSSTNFVKRYKVGQPISLPFLNCSLNIKATDENYVGEEYFIAFNSFDETVSRYRNIQIVFDDKAASILKLSIDGTNKARIVDYLNQTVKVLMKRQLEDKNLFADNTIHYIDTTLAVMEENLKLANNDLKNFSKNKNILEIEKDGINLQQTVMDLDIEKETVNRKLNYYNMLGNYLKNSSDYSKLPAPTIAGIEEQNIVANVSKLIQLSVRRSEMAYATKSETIFNNIDNEISAVKRVLLENINTSKVAINYEYAQISGKMGAAESQIKQLPEDHQELLKITRKYNLSDNIYQTYLEKRSEASIVKAANLSDIKFIDSAKDIGGGLIGPRTGVNYVIAIFMGLLIPLLIVFLIFFINNSVQNTDDISNLTTIPLIGVVGLNLSKSNLAVFEKPKSALSESFRAIRSSLQFLYKRQNVAGTKTLMITSSVSGEGKTFCSLNIATVFALSEKKTVIVGLDLRKPKIFKDFNLTNEIGAVNYLIGQKSIDEIILKTQIPYLDVITSGPIPPNPSELIMGESMKEMLEELKKRYDYIILDTPPVGLVTDAVELSAFSDVTLYVARQNYTKKEMIHLLNNRVKRGELNNVSIILNGFQSKAKYGTGYGYGYGYGYGAYSNGYHEEEEPKNIFMKWYKNLKNKTNKSND